MSEVVTYGFCNNDCKQEIYTKEQILAVLQQAIDNQSLTGIDTSTGFIDSIKDQQGGNALTFSICSSSEYAAIVAADELVANRLYIIKDDATFDDLQNEIAELNSNLTNILNGTTLVPKSEIATKLNLSFTELSMASGESDQVFLGNGTYFIYVYASGDNMNFGLMNIGSSSNMASFINQTTATEIIYTLNFDAVLHRFLLYKNGSIFTGSNAILHYAKISD